MVSSYYKDIHGVILCYDVTDPSSFRNLESWLEEINDNAKQDIVKVLVGNKIDCER